MANCWSCISACERGVVLNPVTFATGNNGVSPDGSDLADWLAGLASVVVVSGAGVSTGSGIPHYRNREGAWRHARPMEFGDFVKHADNRKRYWARSFVGWRHFSRARPNAAHRALASLEASGKLTTLITQNVDGLHQAAGSEGVIELHGDLSGVRCVDCHGLTSRSAWQERLREANLQWHAKIARPKPDGDAELPADASKDFVVPDCQTCNGILKPDVVMFGEAVPRDRVERATAAIRKADALLVVGSSLMVYSGFRFARQANEQRKPIAIVNQGITRADDLAALKIDADCQQVLPQAVSPSSSTSS
jgi:NAD-dependent SIR2 family protein deacetylase